MKGYVYYAITAPCANYTTDAISEETRAELVDAQIYYTTPPNKIHQRISFQLANLINHYINSHQVFVSYISLSI